MQEGPVGAGTTVDLPSEMVTNQPAEADHTAEADHIEGQAGALHADTDHHITAAGTGEAPHHIHTRLVILHSQLQNPAKHQHLPTVIQTILSHTL